MRWKVKKNRNRCLTAVEWAKVWSRNNTRALLYECEGRKDLAEIWELHASIAKDFCCINLIQSLQFQQISKPA